MPLTGCARLKRFVRVGWSTGHRLVLLCDSVIQWQTEILAKKIGGPNSTCKRSHTMASRQKRKAAEVVEELPASQNVIAQFKSVDGESTGPPLNLPVNATPDQLEMLLNQLMNTVCTTTCHTAHNR